MVEEAATFYSTEHLEYTFFACTISYLVCMVIEYEGMSVAYDGFTKFSQATGFWCTAFDGFDCLLFVLVAVLGGILGAVFNFMVEHLNALRSDHINPKAWKRVLEIVVLVLVTGTAVILLPAGWSCEHPTRSMMMTDSIGCLSEEDQLQISHGTVSHKALFDLLNSSDCLGGNHTARMNAISNLTAYRVNEEHRTGTEDQWKDQIYLDNGNSADTTIRLHYQHSYTCESDGDFNAMAMLWLNGGLKGVKVLLQRGFPHMLGADVLLVFCVVYFLLAAYSSGTSVPAGLIIPMLLIGGSYGRAFGVLGLEIKKSWICDSLSTGQISNSFYWSTVYRWVARDCGMPDPGVYAVVGMAAFLGGSGRLTLFLATVMIELTDDASLIFPVGIASIISMIVGNMYNHGLYHGLIPVQSLPYLNSDPSDVMYLVNVQDVMAENCVRLSKFATLETVEKLIKRCDPAYKGSDRVTHNAFPVVDCQKTNDRLRGIIALTDLRRAWGDLSVLHEALVEQHGIDTINLLDYADRSPLTIVPHAKVARAFELFRKLGMRHLCVVNNMGMLIGILTRKDLMTFSIGKNMKRHKAEGALHGWLARRRLGKAVEAKFAANASGVGSKIPASGALRSSPRKADKNPRPAMSPARGEPPASPEAAVLTPAPEATTIGETAGLLHQ